MNPLHLLLRLKTGLASRLRNVWFRMLGVHILGYVWMRRIYIPRNWADIMIESGAALDDGVVLLCSGPMRIGKIHIKRGTYINRNTILDASEKLEIGGQCMIGPGCFLTDSDHGTSSTIAVGQQPMVSMPTILEDGVWLGAGVKVLKGVRIGKGAVVGAGAVVTKNVGAFEIVAGVPVKVIGTRN
jgi:acetyltransferase-like isoleucine patch superfamily enzyme